MTKQTLDTKFEVAAKTGYHHGDLRSQLLNAVRQLVEEKGSENFSIAEAARKAGVSSAAPYRHFNDKPEILKALVLQAMQEKAADMRRVIEPFPAGSHERINALGKCYIDFARNHPGMFRLVFGKTESHENDEDLRQQGEQVFGIVVEAVAQVLGIEKSDPEALKRAYMLWTMVHGHSWLQIDGKAKQQGIEFPEEQLLAEISLRILGNSQS